jgi:hypothetical protein
MLLDEILASDILEMQLSLRIVNDRMVLFKRVCFHRGYKERFHRFFAIGTSFIEEFDALFENAIPATEIMSAVHDSIEEDIFAANHALLKFLIISSNLSIVNNSLFSI